MHIFYYLLTFLLFNGLSASPTIFNSKSKSGEIDLFDGFFDDYAQKMEGPIQHQKDPQNHDYCSNYCQKYCQCMHSAHLISKNGMSCNG